MAAGDYFVVCGDTANVPNCDLDSSPDTNFIQNGSPDGVGLRYNGNLMDAVSYEGDTGAPYTEGSGSGWKIPQREATVFLDAPMVRIPTRTMLTSPTQLAPPARPTPVERLRLF